MSPDRERESRRMLSGLLAVSHLMPLEHLPAEVASHAARAGLHDARIYLCDLQQTELRLLTGAGPDAESLPGDDPAVMGVEGSLPGRAFQHGRTLYVPATGEHPQHHWVPILDGAERLGVLRVSAENNDERALEDMALLAALVALLLMSKRASSDSYARLVRRREMNVAAEMQWHLMPPRAYADERVVICAAMEPAYEVGGDAFDYAIAGSVVHLAVFDAMGHDTAAGLAANLAVAACRNNRRQGVGLVGASEAIEQVLYEQFHRDLYVTGILADLDTHTGVLSFVNRGHPLPIVIRSGRWGTEPACRPAPPMGTALGVRPTLCREQLEPGDRVVLYTDGITEAHRPGAPQFGVNRFIDFLVRHHADALPVPETLRRLIQSILAYNDGRLRDDATVVLLEWHGPTPYPPGRAESLTGIPEPHPR